MIGFELLKFAFAYIAILKDQAFDGLGILISQI